MDAIEEERNRRFRMVERASDPNRVGHLYEVITYKGQREDSRGHHQDLTLEVHFDGSYHVEVFDTKGRVAWGGQSSQLQEALATIGWDDLDEDSHVLAEREQRASPGSWSQADVRRQPWNPSDSVTRGR